MNPKEVISCLEAELLELGVSIIKGNRCKIGGENQSLTLNNGAKINYGHLINCTGLYADKIAKLFGEVTGNTNHPLKNYIFFVNILYMFNLV